MTDDIEIVIADDPEHEELLAEIYYRGSYVCQLSFEAEPTELVVELEEPTKGLRLPLALLEAAISEGAAGYTAATAPIRRPPSPWSALT